MLTSETRNLKLWLTLGGLGFGGYFTLGFLYFETFRFYKGSGILPYLPVLGIFALTCIALALLLFGKGNPRQTGKGLKAGYFLWPFGLFTLAGIIVFFFVGSQGPQGHSIELLTRIFRDLLLVGLLPVATALMVLQGKRQSKKGIVPLESSPTVPTQSIEGISFQQGISGPELHLDLEDLILVEAADNYCKIHYLEASEPRMEMLRIKMKEVETQLGTRGNFFRCHRSFLVNGAKVEAITGSSQSHKLQVHHFSELVPVSRSFDLDPLREFMVSPSQQLAPRG